jgi:hypothetical protein
MRDKNSEKQKKSQKIVGKYDNRIYPTRSEGYNNVNSGNLPRSYSQQSLNQAEDNFNGVIDLSDEEYGMNTPPRELSRQVSSSEEKYTSISPETSYSSYTEVPMLDFPSKKTDYPTDYDPQYSSILPDMFRARSPEEQRRLATQAQKEELAKSKGIKKKRKKRRKIGIAPTTETSTTSESENAIQYYKKDSDVTPLFQATKTQEREKLKEEGVKGEKDEPATKTQIAKNVKNKQKVGALATADVSKTETSKASEPKEGKDLDQKLAQESLAYKKRYRRTGLKASLLLLGSATLLAVAIALSIFTGGLAIPIVLTAASLGTTTVGIFMAKKADRARIKSKEGKAVLRYREKERQGAYAEYKANEISTPNKKVETKETKEQKVEEEPSVGYRSRISLAEIEASKRSEAAKSSQGQGGRRL